MSQYASFQGSSEIGAHTLLTNKYCLLGKSGSRNFKNSFDVLDLPIIECYMNNIVNIGSLCVGNSKGILVTNTVLDAEILHLKRSLQEVDFKICNERLNALGNIMLANDRICLIHPEVEAETITDIEHILGVDVIKISLGDEKLIGTFAALNNVGMLVHPGVSLQEADELSSLCEVQVIAGTINRGSVMIGSGMVVNDYIAFVGQDTTPHEIAVIESVFELAQVNKESKGRADIESLIK